MGTPQSEKRFASSLQIEITSFTAREAEITAIRTQVFHQEQHIDPVLDFDGLDAEAIQILASYHDQPVGTARARLLGKTAKVERVAVLSAYRQRGIGTAIMTQLLAYLKQQELENVILNAQRPSEPFYQHLGFSACGPVFMEAGIEHIQMQRIL